MVVFTVVVVPSINKLPDIKVFPAIIRLDPTFKSCTFVIPVIVVLPELFDIAAIDPDIEAMSVELIVIVPSEFVAVVTFVPP